MFSWMLVLLFIMTSMADAKQTVWWHTSGSAVMKLDNACSLFIYNKDQAAIVSWQADGSEMLAFQDQQLHFQDNDRLAVAIRIDDHFLTGDLVGSGSGNILTVPLAAPIDGFLPEAKEIEVKMAKAGIDTERTISVDTAKMPALLRAVEKCRAVLHRRS